jgi:flagellin-like hook-associated protein FlgL
MESLNFTERMSEVEDTEITESIVLLQQEEIAYQAALAVGSQLLKSTLMNYLE